MEGGFTFNFFQQPGGEGGQAAAAAQLQQQPAVQPAEAAGAEGNWAEAEEVLVDAAEAEAAARQLSGFQEVEVHPGVWLLKGTLTSVAAATLLQQSQVQESDLIPRQYEGGFKLWEGAMDLAGYLAASTGLGATSAGGASGEVAAGGAAKGPAPVAAAAADADSLPQANTLQGKRVLELGCGHGLPGILCLMAGAHEVHFQDYNRQVLMALTLPNVRANAGQRPPSAWAPAGGAAAGETRLFSGDWQHLGALLASNGLGGHYDLVLAAEAIYSLESQPRLLACIKQVLAPPHGTALIAAKSFYFGVGGGVAGFQKLVEADGTLQCERVWVKEDGTSNKREILQLSFPGTIAPFL